MKKLLYSIVFAACALSTYAQESVQAAIKPTPAVPNGVSVFLKSTGVAATGKIASLVVTFAIPTSVGARPTITVNNSPNTSVTYPIQNSPDEMIQGVSHYVYNILGDGDQGAAAIVFSLPDGVENEVVRVTFSGGIIPSQVKVANIPGGGLGGNSFFGFNVAGSGDRVNTTSMFYAVPTVSTAQNEIIPGGYGGLSITSIISTPLPVKFNSFSATKKDNDALLSWVVENETALVTNYEVERSIDGIKFDKINTIAKNTGSLNIYNITDPNLSAVKNGGIIYYRIKQIDANGEFVYSDIKNVRLTEKGTLISAFPNPVADITTVKIDVLEATDATISLINVDGKQLQTSTLKAQKGLNLKKIDMNNLAKGDYLLKVTIGSDVQTIKIIKL